MNDFEGRLEAYLADKFHPNVAPHIRREIALGTISIEGFLRLADVFQANHDALDADMLVSTAGQEKFDFEATVHTNGNSA